MLGFTRHGRHGGAGANSPGGSPGGAPGVARDRSLDSTMALLLAGYTFIAARCDRYGTDAFETRLLGRKTVCCRGSGAAQLFYDSARMQREDVSPKPVQRTLTGTGGVQGLDGEAHYARKQMFMALMTPERIGEFIGIFDDEWRRHTSRWEPGRRFRLFDEAGLVLCKSACRWSGVPLPESNVAQRTSDLRGMVDAGPWLRHLRARAARRRSEAWAAGLIEAAREGNLAGDEAQALPVIARHRGPDGNLLDVHMAAVELLNVLRPAVAIATYVTYAALALHRHPNAARVVDEGGEQELESFVHEVRRYYPFFPFAAARAAKAFEWQGYRFEPGTRVLLDIYGTNHHPRDWLAADKFLPERFLDAGTSPFGLIPQGGGTFDRHHRCAGEWLTIELMKKSVLLLRRQLDYGVPDQDLRVNLRRVPTLPADCFIIGVNAVR